MIPNTDAIYISVSQEPSKVLEGKIPESAEFRCPLCGLRYRLLLPNLSPQLCGQIVVDMLDHFRQEHTRKAATAP